MLRSAGIIIVGVIGAASVLVLGGFARAPEELDRPGAGPVLRMAAASVRSFVGEKVSVTYALSSYSGRVVVSAGRPSSDTRLDTTRVSCHGGVAHVAWYIGDLEPETPGAGIHVSAYMDGTKIATLIKGGGKGIWEDGPASIDTVVRCPRGRHVFWVERTQTDSLWGFPYANQTDRVQRGFIVTEYWR
jgi:hypothetical protein